MGRMEFDMWMCEVCIVVDQKNADGNTLIDLVAALKDAGASVENIDEERHVVYAQVSAADLPTIRLMEGVAYVRVVYQYHADRPASTDVIVPATTAR